MSQHSRPTSPTLRGRLRHLLRGAAVVAAGSLLATGVAVTVGFAGSASAATPTLPFDLALNASSGKLVFAHYFTPYPVSFDNVTPSEIGGSGDYYDYGYLNPNGENGSHSAYGGLLRDRPIPRAKLSVSDYWSADLATEITQASSVGIDGFTVDLLGTYSTTNRNSLQVQLLMAQADRLGFKILLMPDMSTLGSQTPATVADTVAKYAMAHPTSAYHLADGRLVLSPFLAEAWSTSTWTTFFTALAGYTDPVTGKGFSVAFVPCFLNFGAYASAFNTLPQTYGFSNWGNRSPSGNSLSSLTGLANTAHSYGKIWMQPVSVQDERPMSGVYDEAQNTTNLRMTWAGAIAAADWVQIPTWNDYSEGAQLAPSWMHGWAYADLDAYYLQWFKNGTAPTIVRDAVYLTHRQQPYAAKPSYPETQLMSLRSGSSPARDTVEAVSMLTAPASVTITVGGVSTTCSAPAGVSVCTAPLQPGRAAVAVVRGGTLVTSVATRQTITTTPYVQDLQYVAADSLRDGPADPSLIVTPTPTPTPTPTDTQAPSQPVVSAAVSGYNVTLSWPAATDDTGVTGYSVYRSSTTPVALTSSTLVSTQTGLSFTDSGRAPGTWYYAVVARDAAGNTSTPGTASAVVADTTAPGAPGSVRATVSSYTATLGWTAPSDNVGVTGYQVFRSSTSPVSLVAANRIATTTALGYSDAGLAVGSWYYAVVAVDAAGNTSAPGTASASVVDVTAPSTPAVTAGVSGYDVSLGWPAATDNVGVTGYDVYRSSSPSTLGTRISTTTGLSQTDVGRTPGTWYYSVIATDAAGNQSAAGTATVVVADVTAPTTPAATFTATGSTVSLAWTPASDNVGVTGYQIYRSTSAFTPDAATLVATTGADQHSYDDPGRAVGSWFYAVVAVDAAGNASAPGTLSTSVTDVTPPSTPVMQAAANATGDGSGSVTVSWDAASDDVGVVGYEVYRSTAPFVPDASTLVATTTATTLEQTGLAVGTYYYAVVARDAAGNASPPSELTVATVLDVTAPSTPSVTGSVSSSKVRVSWSASTDDVRVAGYQVDRTQAGLTATVATVTGTSYSATLPVGTWTFTVRAVDEAGNLSDPSSVTLVVKGRTTRTMRAAADTWVNSAAATTNYGGQRTLQTGGRGRTAMTYLKFAVPAAPEGQDLVSARLYVRVDGARGSGSASKQLVLMATGGWDERSLTWRDRARASRLVVGRLVSANRAGVVYEIVLTPSALGSVVDTGGTLALVLTSAGRDPLTLYSVQSGSVRNGPLLALTYG